MTLEVFSPTEAFLTNPCIVTGTLWKFEVLLGNLQKLIEKHSAEFTIPFTQGYLDNVSNVDFSVEEKDTMIGTPDLIIQKARDQVISMWNKATDPEQRDLIPQEFSYEVENGGQFGTIATDIAAREIWHDEQGRNTGSWRRVLNFNFSKPVNKLSAEEMRSEIDDYCDLEYGRAARSASRAIDSTIGLTYAIFPIRTSLHKKQGIYVEPKIDVFVGKETAGITMDVHPLSDPTHRAKFLSEHVGRCKAVGMNEKEAYQVFDGRAGLARIEDLIIFCRAHDIDLDVKFPDVDENDELEAIRMIAEGGSYNLFAAVLLYAHTHKYAKSNNEFAVIREPKNSAKILI